MLLRSKHFNVMVMAAYAVSAQAPLATVLSHVTVDFFRSFMIQFVVSMKELIVLLLFLGFRFYWLPQNWIKHPELPSEEL